MNFSSARRPKAKQARRRIDIKDEDEDQDVISIGDDSDNARTAIDLGVDSAIVPQASTPPVQNSQPDEEIAVVFKKKLKGLKHKSKPKPVLSFREEEQEEDGPFTVHKTAASKRMAKSKLNRDLLPDRESAATDTAASAMYSAESLRSLRESQRTAPPRALHLQQQQQPTMLATEDVFSSSTAAGGLDIANGGIPDPAAIHAAKKAREQKRAAGVIGVPEGDENDSGFISLAVTKQSGGREVGQVLKNASRLVHEDDEEGEGEEAFADYERDRLAFGSAAVKEEEARRLKEFAGNLVQAQNESHVEEEVDRWEREQMQKAKKHAPINKAVEPKAKGPEATKIPNAVPILPLADVTSRLASTLAELQISHRARDEQLAHVRAELARSTAASTALADDLRRSGERHDFFHELRTYVGDLAEFLDVKFAELEEIEAECKAVAAAGLRIATEQRRVALDHWFGTFMEWSPPPSTEMDVDDDTPLMTEADMADTTARAHSRLAHMFHDAGAEFRSLRMIKQRFDTWGAKFPKDYADAYGSLSIPGIFELFVRHEMAAWEPENNPIRFDASEWHAVLATEGTDESLEVLKRVVEKVVAPALARRAATYDPFSLSQTRNVTAAVTQCLDYLDTGSDAFKALTAAYQARLSATTAALVERYGFYTTRPRQARAGALPQSLPLQAGLNGADEGEQKEREEARDHWFWTTFALLDAAGRWAPRLGRELSARIIGDELLNRALVPVVRMGGARSGEVVKFEKIVQALPASWLRTAPAKVAEEGIMMVPDAQPQPQLLSSSPPAFLGMLTTALSNYRSAVTAANSDPALAARLAGLAQRLAGGK
ncbi:hypothetical protein HDU90_002938 [Geranomyces variabilis]|nr:hypothetical protein HDU90_002938 [Geranomyces variabilis]